jgi:hypothetical protein
MRTRTYRTLLTLLLALAVAVITPLTHAAQAHAAPPEPATPTPDVQHELEAMRQQQEARDAAIQRMEQYLYVTPDGTFALKVQNGAQIGVDAALFTELSQGMQQTNAQLRVGNLQLGQVKLDTPSLAEQRILDRVAPDEAVTEAACTGRNGVDYYWWGYRAFYDSCNTTRLIGLIELGGAGAGARTLLPIPATTVPCGILTVAFAAG